MIIFVWEENTHPLDKSASYVPPLHGLSRLVILLVSKFANLNLTMIQFKNTFK